MMLSQLSFAYTGPVAVPAGAARAASPAMDAATFKKFVDSNVVDTTLEKPWSSGEISDKAGLKALAVKLNPVVGYWDPLNIGMSGKETIGWFRHAEIKHGRVAMAAFVGYCIQATGFHFPWNLQGPLGLAVPSDTPTISFADISAAGGPADQWDALPSAAKIQILMGIGFLEMVSEASVFLEMDGEKHYVRGGKPGYFPTIIDKMPHPVRAKRRSAALPFFYLFGCYLIALPYRPLTFPLYFRSLCAGPAQLLGPRRPDA